MNLPLEIKSRMALHESFLLSSDYNYIGRLSLNKFHPESVCNQYGVYGSRYSSKSITNQYSMFGSPYSTLSPFNPYTLTPPYIVCRGVIVGRLSKNAFLNGYVLDPDQIIDWMRQHALY